MKTHKFRVRPRFITALKYLEWKSVKEHVESELTKQYILDSVLSVSKSLIQQGNVSISLKENEGYRHHQRFSLSEENLNYVKEFAEENNILVAESLEIHLYIYCVHKLKPDEFKHTGLEEWSL